MRLACWRARPRDHELPLGPLIVADGGSQRKGCFGATPKPTRETRALPRDANRARLLACAFAQSRSRVLAIEFCNETGADLGGTHCFGLVSVGAIAESFRIHHAHHFQDSAFSFRIALRQKR